MEFFGHERGDGAGHCDGGVCVEEESAGASGEDVFDGAGELVARGPDDLGGDVGEGGMEALREAQVSGGEVVDGFGERAVDIEMAEVKGVLRIAVDGQVVGTAGALVERAEGDGVVDAILGHVAVGGPLAAGDGEQPVVVDVDDVVAGERRGFAASGVGLYEGADTGVDAEDVSAGGRMAEVLGGGFEDEVDFFFEGARLVDGLGNGCVGGSDDGVIVPGNGEEDTAIAGARHHEGAVSAEEGFVEDEMNALAGRNHTIGAGVGHVADDISEDASGVDDDFGGDVEGFAGFGIARGDATDEAVRSFIHGGDGHVVEEGGAMVGGGGDEVDEEACVVELAVVVDDSAAEVSALNVGEAFDGFVLREDAGFPESIAAGEEVVDFESRSVEGCLPPGVVGDDEGEVADEMGRVLAQEAAFFECGHDQGDVALFKIADAAVDELGAAAGGAFAEVHGFEKENVEAARGGIDGDPRAGCAAADDEDVPGGGAGLKVLEHLAAIHRLAHPLERSTALCQRLRPAAMAERSLRGVKRVS